MTHILHPIRPARAAIAAVLALTATPLLAQEAPAMPDPMPMQQASPPASPPAVSPEPQSVAPQAQPMAVPPAASLPGSPVPMAMPVAPNANIGVPVTAIAPPATLAMPETPAARVTRAAPQRVRTSAPASAPIAADRTPEPVAAAPAPVEASAEPVAVAPAVPVAPTGVDQVQAQPAAADANGSNGEVWGWMAALLAALGIGGGAIALRRTRTRNAATAEHSVVRDEVIAPTAPVAVSRSTLAGPHDRVQSEGIVAAPAVAPAEAMPAAPMRYDKPMAQMSSPARAAGGDDINQRRLENMIAQRPSRDNPFVTRANRKRRAMFLLHNRYPMQSAA